MDRWICRFLDQDGSTRARSSMIADYMRCLRMLGRSSERAELAWRQLCVTCDPLVSGRSAANQFRKYLDQVEQALGPIPEDFPHPGFQECSSAEEIREARKTWADTVMSSALNVGSASGRTAGQSGSERPGSVSGTGVESHLGGSTEPFAEPPTADELLVSPVTEAAGSSTGVVDEEDNRTLVTDEIQTEGIPVDDRAISSAHFRSASRFARKVQVRTALRDFGQCLIEVTDGDDGRVIFDQVSTYLTKHFEGPPIPCRMLIGETVEDAEYLDVKNIFVHLFDEHEVPTVWCDHRSVDGSDLSGVGITPKLCLEAVRDIALLSTGDLSLMPQREVIVKSHLRLLGTCVVAVPDGSTPLTVFGQVSAFLSQSHRIPPLARWMFVGEDRKSGMALNLETTLINQVLDTEQLTVECLEQGFSLSLGERVRYHGYSTCCCLVAAWLLLGCHLLLFVGVIVAFGVSPSVRRCYLRVQFVTFGVSLAFGVFR